MVDALDRLIQCLFPLLSSLNLCAVFPKRLDVAVIRTLVEIHQDRT